MNQIESPLVGTLAIGSRTSPSRVMFGPHETNLAIGRDFSPAHAAYYARRAAGGAGIIVLEEAAVHPWDWPYERAPLAARCGSGWAAVCIAIRAAVPEPERAPVVLAAIGHSGGQGISHWSQREIWAPSPAPEVATREVPKEMERQDIDEIVAGFGAATRLAVSSGLDGVEVNAGQFSLVRQFLSGLTNMRADEFGADRLLFARMVLEAVRKAAGSEIVGLRLSIDELAPWAGIIPEAGVELAVALAPFVDVITVVSGSIFSAARTRPDGHVEPGFGIDLARQVRVGLRAAGFTIPVVAQGSIVDVGQAAWALESGAADAVEMTRAQLADAELVNKVRADQSARIRPCVLCNQTCKVRDNRNPIITCVVDPRTGHETIDLPEPTSMAASSGRRVTVVGGGVAGLETARVAALLGAQVTVHERSAEFGGVIRTAARGSGRGRLELIASWLEAECRFLGVELIANSTYTESMHTGSLLSGARVGQFVLATGGVPGPLPFLVEEGAAVFTAAQVLDSTTILPVDGVVAVWDPIGGPIAISVAELLASIGRTVVLLTPDLLVGEKLALSGDLAPSQPRLHGAGVKLVKRALLRKVTASTLEYEDKFSGVAASLNIAALVNCHHSIPDLSLDPTEQLLQAGDRVAPRTILEAVREGRLVGRQAAHS